MMPFIDHESFAHYSVANGNTEMKDAMAWVGANNMIVAGGGFEGSSEVRLGSPASNQNGNNQSFMIRRFDASVNKAVFSFDIRFTGSTTIASDIVNTGSGFFCIQDETSIDNEIMRAGLNSNITAWNEGVVLTVDRNRSLSAYVRNGTSVSTNLLIARYDKPIYSLDPSDIYNHEVLLDVSSPTAVLKVRVNGMEVINATFNRDAVSATYRVTQIVGCGWSSPNTQGGIVHLSNVLAYAEDSGLAYPAGPLTLSTIETGLSALDTHPANPGTYDIVPAAGKTYAMNDVGPSIPPGTPVHAAYLEARMAAVSGGQPESIALEVLDSAGAVLASNTATLIPGFPDRILVTDVTDQIGDIAAVNGAQARIRRAD